MNARDIDDMEDIIDPLLMRKTSGKYIAQMLVRSGYRKPRTITTVQELDALPAWTVVRSEQATVWEKFKGNVSDFWAETMTLGKHPSDHIALPATVLHEPGPGS